MERVDVLIVGGGPAGLSTAHALCMNAPGTRVLVVHRDAEIGRPVRTSGGSWLCHLRELEIPAGLYSPMTEALFAGPSRESLTRFGADHPVVLDVTATYRYLARLAVDAGAEIRTATTLADVTDEGDSFLAVMTCAGGARVVRARWLVDATGVARAAVQRLGLLPGFERLGVGAEFEYENLTADDRRVTLFVGSRYCPSGYGWVFPCPGGRVRVGVGILRPDSSRQPRVLLERFMQSGEPARFGLRTGRLIEKHYGVIPAEHAPPRLVYGRVVCVGDSACQALPLVGEGIRYCIASGRRAGESIAAAMVERSGAEESIAAYTAWWDRTYRVRFNAAQRANMRLARYSDEDWDLVAGFFRQVPAPLLARALRMEFPVLGWAMHAARRPLATAEFCSRAMAR